VTILIRCYFAALAAWAVAHFAISDERLAALFLLNAAAPWLFTPAIVLAVPAIVQGRRWIGVGCSATAALAAGLFADGVLPKPGPTSPSGPTLTAMTYNVGAWNRHPDKVVGAIHASGADLIGLFELRPAIADVVRNQLQTRYPYQVLAPDDAGVHGIGAISRFPLQPLLERLPGDWPAPPQLFTVQWPTRDVLWVNVHARSPGVAITAWREHRSIATAWRWLSERRQEETQAVYEFAQRHAEALVITADLNVTPYNSAYTTVTAELQDTWRIAGFGWGHTWSFLRRQLGIPVWLARIDYVLCSRDWLVHEAKLSPWDKVSDHRPIVATLSARSRTAP
jgi:endonuclease/exonuclease/phosphatase (EEP) superfamily protein YafD